MKSGISVYRSLTRDPWWLGVDPRTTQRNWWYPKGNCCFGAWGRCSPPDYWNLAPTRGAASARYCLRRCSGFGWVSKFQLWLDCQSEGAHRLDALKVALNILTIPGIQDQVRDSLASLTSSQTGTQMLPLCFHSWGMDFVAIYEASALLLVMGQCSGTRGSEPPSALYI